MKNNKNIIILIISRCLCISAEDARRNGPILKWSHNSTQIWGMIACVLLYLLKINDLERSMNPTTSIHLTAPTACICDCI